MFFFNLVYIGHECKATHQTNCSMLNIQCVGTSAMV